MTHHVTIEREALQTVLQALESCDQVYGSEGSHQYFNQVMVDKAVTIIKKAQTQPVAWADAEAISNLPAVDEAIRALLDDKTADNATAVVQAILGATPPARPAAPLTDEQIGNDPIFRAGVRFAEAAHKITKGGAA
jgi:hypothetical protein